MLPDVSTEIITLGMGALYAVPAGYWARLRGAAQAKVGSPIKVNNKAMGVLLGG